MKLTKKAVLSNTKERKLTEIRKGADPVALILRLWLEETQELRERFDEARSTVVIIPKLSEQKRGSTKN